MQTLTDKERIVAKAQEGNREAFSVLVKEHQRYAFNLAFRLTCDEDDAKDVVQDSFVKIWKSLKRFDSKMKFTTWMYSIVTNTAIDLNRKKKKIETNNSLMGDSVQYSYENPHSSLSNKELSELLELATRNLSEKQKAVFILKDIQGVDTEEVCEIMEQSPENIKSNLYHARKSVREYISRIINFERNE